MGHSVKASLWCYSLLIKTRFRFLYFRMSIRKLAVAFYMINEIQPKIKFQKLLSASDVTLKQRAFKRLREAIQVIIILPIKSKMVVAKKQRFLRFRY